jgi:hypothetical protein
MKVRSEAVQIRALTRGIGVREAAKLPMRDCVAAAAEAYSTLRRAAGRRFLLSECGDAPPHVDLHE